MKINFVLPFYTKVPGGGTKIMYEYANRLSILGHNVVIYHLVRCPYFNYKRYYIVQKLINLFIYKNKPIINWFIFDKKIQLKFLNRLNNDIRDADATVVTWWSLVEPLSKLKDSKGKKINIIQGYEDWTGHEDLLKKSYQFKNVVKIGISPFVIEKVKEINDNIIYIPNSVDSDKFFQTKKITDREKLSFCMMYSEEKTKASHIGIKAFINLKKDFPNLILTMFGTLPRPIDLPSWIKYIQNPENLNLLYNDHRYFVTNSILEGWGLPAHESMCCGNILICSDIKGHKQFYDKFDGVFKYKCGDGEDLINLIKHIINISDDCLINYSSINITIKEVYSWSKTIPKFLSIFNEK